METDLIGVSANIARVRELIQRIADTVLNTVVYGETGVGKELVVKSLYEKSERNGGPFVKVNCAALPDNLLKVRCLAMNAAPLRGTPQNAGKIRTGQPRRIVFRRNRRHVLIPSGQSYFMLYRMVNLFLWVRKKQSRAMHGLLQPPTVILLKT